MAQRLLVFDPQDLMQLWCHYTDGAEVPLDIQVDGVSVSKFLQRWIALTCKSDKWPTEGQGTGEAMKMVHLRYCGKKVMKLSKSGVEGSWEETPEAPKRQ